MRMQEAVRTAKHEAPPGPSTAATAAASLASEPLYESQPTVPLPPAFARRGVLGTAGPKQFSDGAGGYKAYAAAYNAAALAAVAGDTGQGGQEGGSPFAAAVDDGSVSEGQSRGTTVVTDLDGGFCVTVCVLTGAVVCCL